MTTYDGVPHDEWMRGLTQMEEFNTRHLLSMFALLGIPESYLDVGCGNGAMVRTAAKLGVRAYGIDQLVEPDWGENFFHVNLVNLFTAPEKVDIVTCFEVAEHIHETAHGTLAHTLCDNLKPGVGHFLIFGAARPGQDGTGHVATRPSAYWHDEFRACGMSYDAQTTMNLALLWSNIRSPLNYFYDNLIVFNR